MQLCIIPFDRLDELEIHLHTTLMDADCINFFPSLEIRSLAIDGEDFIRKGASGELHTCLHYR